MVKITGNEPAHPTLIQKHPDFWDTIGGLTIRQHFAGLFMQGLLAAWGNHDVTDYGDLASDAVLAAGKLIEELNK